MAFDGTVFLIIYSEISGNCDFEKGTCSWTNPTGIDDFDWILGRGNTPSTNTGPSSDHTLGNPKGNP